MPRMRYSFCYSTGPRSAPSKLSVKDVIMPDLPDNQYPPTAPPQAYVPVTPVAAPPPKQGSSALKIVLIVLAIFVVLGLLVAGVVGYGIYKVAHAVHTAANGQVTIGTPGSGFSANTGQTISESDLGIAIYPGSPQGQGSLHMAIAGKTMVSANYLTSDSK